MADTSVWGCGAASYAKGLGGTETVFSPKPAKTLQAAGNYISLSAGNLTSFGVNTENKVFSWGEDEKEATLVKTIDFPVRAVVQHEETAFGCVLGVDGSVWAWGKSEDFLTGLATELPVDLKNNGPLRLEGFDSRVVKVSLGAKHSVALTEKGTVYTWGTGRGVGLDPSGPMPYNATPGKVTMPDIATDVAAGDGFTVVCCSNGNGYIWGDLLESEEWTPKQVNFLGNANVKITAVAAGDRHIVVLTDSGLVYVWGENDNGELGNGTDRESKKAPIKLQLTNIVAVRAYKSSCFAINDKGDVYTWGSNVWGHLGLGHINPIHAPTLVGLLSTGIEPMNGSVSPKPTPASAAAAAAQAAAQAAAAIDPVKVLDVVMGFNHTLYLVAPRESTLSVMSSVYKFDGEPRPYPLPAPASVDAPKGQAWTTGSITGTGSEPNDEVVVWRPSPHWEGKTLVSVATSSKSSWSVLSDGCLFAWGNGTLGTGEETQNHSNPSRLWDLDGHRIKTVVAGLEGDWAMAITEKGLVYAWGEGTDFRTGLGGTSKSQFPRMVEFPSPVKALSLGHTHGIAVTQDYNVYTWGTGKGLGNGGRTNIERSPKRIQGAETLGVCNVTAGRGFSTALTLSGTVYCWGESADGRLGLDEEGEFLSPTFNSTLENLKVVQVVSGVRFSLALIDDGRVFSWGYGGDGCLGFGPNNLEPKVVPTHVPFFDTVGKMAYLFASATSAFAISQTGGLYAWGSPHLGVGTGRSIATPTRVAALQKYNVQSVAPGEWQSLAWVGPKDHPAPLAPGLTPAWGPVPDSARLSVMNGGGSEETMPEINVDSSAAPITATTASESATPIPPPKNSPANLRHTSKLDLKRQSIGPAPPDPAKFAQHTKAIENVPSVHRFFPLEPELDKVAQLGNIDEVRKFLNSPKGFEAPSDVHNAAIKKCASQVKKDEIIIKGWVVLSINKQDFESERILIITDKAHYRFKYDFKKNNVIHNKRFAAVSVFQVFSGRFKDVSKVSGKVRGDAYEKQCGIQVWFSDPADWKPPSVLLPFQKIRVPYTIFRPFMGGDATYLQQETVCNEICLALEATVHWYRNGSSPIEYMHEFIVDAPKRFDGYPPFPCRKVPFIARAPLTLSSGLLSVAHNKWLVPKK